MLLALVTGLFVSFINLLLHALSLLGLRYVFTRHVSTRFNFHDLLYLALIMGITTSLLSAAHLVEITVWGVTFHLLHLANSWHLAFYDAFMSFTSLGFSLPSHSRWILLEPISTLNGIMLAGLSTTVMFEVLSRTTQTRFGAVRRPRARKSA